MRDRWLYAAITVAAVALGGTLWFLERPAGPPKPAPPSIGQAALYAATFTDESGQSQALGRFQGRVVLLNFWVFTCYNCTNTVPSLVDFDRKYRDRGLTLIGIHTPEFPPYAGEHDRGNVERALAQYGIRYPNAQDNDSRTWDLYRIRFWPSFVLIDTEQKTSRVFLERDTIGHPQFCPDDDDLILYAGPLTDRVWLTDRSGAKNRRLYQREDKMQWVTHEVWVPGRRTVAFVDWPRGMRMIDVDRGVVRQLTYSPAWHAAPDDAGERFVCDTNFPDRGLHKLLQQVHEYY